MGPRTFEGKSSGGVLICHSFPKIQREVPERCLASRHQVFGGEIFTVISERLLRQIVALCNETYTATGHGT